MGRDPAQHERAGRMRIGNAAIALPGIAHGGFRGDARVRGIGDTTDKTVIVVMAIAGVDPGGTEPVGVGLVENPRTCSATSTLLPSSR